MVTAALYSTGEHGGADLCYGNGNLPVDLRLRFIPAGALSAPPCYRILCILLDLYANGRLEHDAPIPTSLRLYLILRKLANDSLVTS